MELEEGDYRVVKILAIGDGLVHLRMYGDRFVERPFDVDPTALDLVAIHESIGIPHLPLSAEDFATWRPGVVGHDAVSADELVGYEYWLEAHEPVRSRSGRARA